MIIKISNLSEGVHNFSFDEPVEKIGLGEPFYGSFNLEARLEKSHDQVILDAGIKLNANFDCDRCNSAYNSVISSNYKMVYLFGNNPVDDDNEPNVTYLPADADKINLEQDLRDYALLAIPMKKLCKEDCKGLCPSCGKDLNEGNCGCPDKEIDARWQPLMELKNKLSNN